jgi:ADP-ribose pyrophosphatase YjhB (NUDIX family)
MGGEPLIEVAAHPAASSNSGESIDDGLRREAREETGLDIESIALTGAYKNMTRGIIAFVFRCKITGGELATTDETAACRRQAAATTAPGCSNALGLVAVVIPRVGGR